MAPDNLLNDDDITINYVGTDDDSVGEAAAVKPTGGEHGFLTRKERRRRYILLVLLLLLLALLAYSVYYFANNRSLPSLDFTGASAPVTPPQYLYSITGEGASQMGRPVGLDVTDNGRVYVVDFNSRRISVFTKPGEYLFSFTETVDGPLRNPVHIAVLDDEVWVTDRRFGALYVFDLEGEFLRKIAPPDGDTWGPLALAFSQGGELRITDVGNSDNHRLLLYSAEGDFVKAVGTTVAAVTMADAPGGFLFPNGVAVAEDGRIFVSDGDNRRVQVFTSDGEFLRIIETSGVPRGITIDDQERLYVVNAIAHTVDVYDLDGKRITQFGVRGFGPGQFNYPNNVVVDDTRIYVTDRENHQVQVWTWPVAQPPALAPPTSPLGWLACLAPLLLLPLLLLRKIRIVVTPEFVESLITAGEIPAVARRRRLRLIIPEEDLPLYEGRVVDDVKLTDILYPEPYSEPDAKAISDRIGTGPRESMLFAMADRAKALATNDVELRRLAILLEQRTVTIEQFSETFLRRG